MCQRSPGPRCAAHASKALLSAAKELDALEKDGADKKTITAAKKKLAETVAIYDSTPTGQKRLAKQIEEYKAEGKPTGKLKYRLDAGKRLRDKQERDLAELVREEGVAEYRREQVERIRKDLVEYGDDPTQVAMAKYVVSEGVFLTEGRQWGGPATDWDAMEHLEKCGVLTTGDISEQYTWSTHDITREEDHVGFAMDTTCNCGEIFERPVVVENATIGSVIAGVTRGMTNDDAQSWISRSGYSDRARLW